MKYLYRGKIYRFNSFLGILFSQQYKTNCNDFKLLWNNKLPAKCEQNIGAILNPYNISPHYPERNRASNYSYCIVLYAKILIWAYSHCYPLLWIMSKFQFNIYKSSIEATDVFCDIIGGNQDILCLPRSIFAATTSSRFKKFGILVIGAALPSHHMHAWVMEDKQNAWRNDEYWINYIPVYIKK